MSYLGFSSKWAANLAEQHHLGEEKEAVLAYAIEIVALTLVNSVLTLLLGWILGVFCNTLACLLTIAAFRHNAGGGHSESPWRCAVITIVVFPLLALMARSVSMGNIFYTDLLTEVSIIIGFASISIYAPVDNAKSPIISPVRRNRLKMWAYLVMTVLTMIIVYLRFDDWARAPGIRISLVLSILWVSFNLTPIGHRLWVFIDQIDMFKGRR